MVNASICGWVCLRERKGVKEGVRERERERERASVGLSQWRWPGAGLFRGQWWPWRWGPGCGCCYSFCRGRVRPEGSSPGCPPLRAESHSPAGHRYSVSPQTQTTISHTRRFDTFMHSLSSCPEWNVYSCSNYQPTGGAPTQRHCFGFLWAGESVPATADYYCLTISWS